MPRGSTISRIEYAVTRTERYEMEFIASTFSAIAGLMFFLNDDLFERFGVWRYIAFLPEWAWGIIFLGLSLLHYALLWHGSPIWRKRSCILRASVWVFVGSCALMADPWLQTGYFFLLFATISLRNFIKIRTEYHA